MLVPEIRRFSDTDLNDTAGWIMLRLRGQYPLKSEGALANWLRAYALNNAGLFIRTDVAIALAEVVHVDLMADPVVYERFVWCKDRQNINHIDSAVRLYEEMKRWTKSMGISKIIVNQSSDVPKERIKECFRRLFTEEMLYARV